MSFTADDMEEIQRQDVQKASEQTTKQWGSARKNTYKELGEFIKDRGTAVLRYMGGSQAQRVGKLIKRLGTVQGYYVSRESFGEWFRVI